tara:strand:+ start:13495 stop:14016 length:522 start_codon:yes stop_codon:yes gene_type:complete
MRRIIKNTILAVVFLSCMLFSSFVTKKIPEKLQQKVNAAITTAYATESFSLSGVSHTDIPQKDYVFKIITKGKTIGYAYVGEANSMKNVFNYVVLFNMDLSIKKTKVLIYREEHGRQIGAQRWLKQFIGMNATDKPNYGENIDAISGATISAKSMTIAVNGVLTTITAIKNSL